MQSLKRSLRFRWSSSQMEANLEASDLTATELPPTYLRAFHSLIALDSSSTFLFERAAPTAADPKRKMSSERVRRTGKMVLEHSQCWIGIFASCRSLSKVG